MDKVPVEQKSDDKLEERRQKRLEAKMRIQALYEEVSKDFQKKSSEWLRMVEELEAYAAPAVWAVLNKSAFNTATSYEAVTETAREAIYGEKVFEGYRRMLVSNPDCMFSDYCRGIYRHKALNYLDKMITRARMEKDIDQLPLGVTDENEMFGGLELSEAERFLKYYVDAVMASDANPFHIIMLCYSKILPVILHLTNCDSADKWAWAHMQDKTMGLLSEEFVQVFNSTMRAIRASWGENYKKALEEPYTNRAGNVVPLSEAILTDEFKQSNTKNWVARINARLRKQIVARILNEKDEDMIQLAMRYTQKKYSI